MLCHRLDDHLIHSMTKIKGETYFNMWLYFILLKSCNFPIKERRHEVTTDFSLVSTIPTLIFSFFRLDEKKRYLIGYFDTKESKEYETFRRVASNLKDDCTFYGGFGEVKRIVNCHRVT